MSSPPAGERGHLRLVIADDSLLAREAITAMVESVPGLEVVALCEDFASLVAAVAAARPDVVIADIRMGPSWTDEGIQAATHLRRTHPGVGVVILSQYLEASYVLELLRLGSEGRAYLLKERLHSRQDLAAAVRAVAGGGSVIDPKVVELLVAARSRPEGSPLDQLSTREREILREIATGKGNAAIARMFHLSKRSVENHIHSIFGKLGLAETEEVSRRVKATLIFLADDPQAAERSSERV